MDSPGVDPVAIGLPAEDAPSGAASTPFAPERLRYFVTESNRIEGIRRTAMARELRAHARLLASERVTVADLERFVQDVAGKPLRRHVGYDVRVGSHIAPPGGPAIEIALAALLDDVAAFADPYRVHVIYETLHPFLDGNGRSGRALWLWQMLHQHEAHHALRMGFLHLFYYQTLSHSGERGSASGSSLAAQVNRPPPGETKPKQQERT